MGRGNHVHGKPIPGDTYRGLNMHSRSRYVGSPTDYYFIARHNGQTIPTTSVTKIEFDQVILDPRGMYDGTTNYRFTCPYPGVWLVTCRIETSNFSGTGSLFGIFIRKGGVNRSIEEQYAVSAKLLTSNLCYFETMNQGDYLEAFAYQTSGGNITLLASDYQLNSHFSAIRVGDIP